MTAQKEYRRIWLLIGVFVVLAGVILAAALTARLSLPENVGRRLTSQEQTDIIARNSPLTEYVFLSPNADFPRTSPIQKITIHHMAGTLSLERVGEIFSESDRQSSANYGIDTEGRVGLYVEECNRPWSSSNEENDQQAVTIEVANDVNGGDWHVSDASYETLLDLCTDICLRNGIEELIYTGDETGNLTLHKMFAETECPGPYLESRIPDLVEEVNQRLRTGG